MEFFAVYSYLTYTIYFCFVWSIFFILASRENRREILHLSLMGLFAGLIFGPVYSYDWWNPVSIFMIDLPMDLELRIEDLFLGVGVVGVVSTCYEIVLREKELTCHGTPQTKTLMIGFFTLLFGGLGIAILTITFQIHSLVSSCIGATALGLIMYAKRPDLLKIIPITTFTMLMIALPAYIIPMWLNPSWISDAWMIENLSGYLLLGIPIEEFLWFALIAVVIGPLWEYSRSIVFVK